MASSVPKNITAPSAMLVASILKILVVIARTPMILFLNCKFSRIDIVLWGSMNRTDRRQEMRRQKRHCAFLDYGTSMSLSGAEAVAEAADITA